MRKHNATNRPYSARLEDIVLAVLGFLAGPLLWWMGQTWQQNPAATSIQTIEYWIALLCGFLGIGLSTMWAIFLLAGFGFAIAMKTKNKVVRYWSGLFTPKFLQRIITSVIGIQLTFGSQAFAQEEAVPEPTEITSRVSDNPFMPELAEMSAATDNEATAHPVAPPSTAAPSPEPSAKVPSSSASTTESTPDAPQPRQSSQIKSNPVLEPTVDSSGTDNTVEPTPRQTTTILVTQEHTRDRVNHEALTRGLPTTYSPEKPVPSPYIAAPNPDRSIEEPTLVVQTGDCLWDIAHQELGAETTLPQIDQRWRQWWQHNLEIIGENPHALSPGSVLKAPPFTH